MKNQQVIKGLNELLLKTNDAAAGYHQCAEMTTDVASKEMFEYKTNQRKLFSNELKELLISLGEYPTDKTSVLGDLHRTWIDVKTFVSGSKNEAILEEVERGEKASIEDYISFLAMENIPSSILVKVTEQKEAIVEALHKAEILEKRVD